MECGILEMNLDLCLNTLTLFLLIYAAGPAVNPATGLPDYSAQWAEYYRSIGYVGEAEKIEQQVRNI